MLRSLAVPPLLLILLTTTSLTIDAKPIKAEISTTHAPVEDSTYMHRSDGTITMAIDSDVILTTGSDSETFSEPSPLGLTEEPLPDSVLYPEGEERAQEVPDETELTRSPIDSKAEAEIKTVGTTTEKKSKKKSYRFGATTSPSISLFTQKPDLMVTDQFQTTQYEDYTTETATAKNYFARTTRPAGLDMEMAENRMETTTDAPPLQDKKQDYFTMTTDRAESVPTLSPLFRFFTTSTAQPLFMEPQPETTTMWQESKKQEATTIPDLMESTGVPPSSSNQETESITEEAEITTIPGPISTTTAGPEPLTTRMEMYQKIQYPVSEYTESTIATSATEITNVPETTILSISAPEPTISTTSVPEITTLTTSTLETTTSTTSAPETTTSTTSVPEITTSTTNVPETTTSTTSVPETTTSTTSVPETTISTTSAPETTTSTASVPETTTSTSSSLESSTSTTSAPVTSRTPETTTSTTSAPETTTSTTSAPLATIPSTNAPEATTTTPRPTLTRAPRVERIFNSDGVEVLYGYSSVVRTNRS